MFKYYIEYKDLKEKFIADVKEGLIDINSTINIVREGEQIVDYARTNEKLEDNTENILAADVLRELCFDSNTFNVCDTIEYSIINNISDRRVRARCAAGTLKSAIQLNGQWYLDPYEKLIDNRIKK